MRDNFFVIISMVYHRARHDADDEGPGKRQGLHRVTIGGSILFVVNTAGFRQPLSLGP